MEIGEVYFWTSSCFEWKKLLQPDKYKEVVIDSLRYLASNEKIKVYGFVIMPNHLHFIWEMLTVNGKEMPHASFQKYTAHKIQTDLEEFHPQVLAVFRVNETDREYRFWQRDPLAVKLESRTMLEQKLEYIHTNPLQERWQLAFSPEDYFFSSASFYESGKSDFEFLSHYRDRM